MFEITLQGIENSVYLPTQDLDIECIIFKFVGHENEKAVFIEIQPFDL